MTSRPPPHLGLAPDHLRLRPFTVTDETEARRAHDELAAEDFSFLLPPFPAAAWSEYLTALDRGRSGAGLPDGWVPGAFLAADVSGLLVGRASIRFTLNDWLAAWGGHVGYAVRPRFRRHGFATEILRQSCTLLAAEGIQRALVVCDVGNVGSARAIERCGGMPEAVVDDPEGRARRRYWIDL
jgi:predicted acetyltransferase